VIVPDRKTSVEMPTHTQRRRPERSLTVDWNILVAILFPADIGNESYAVRTDSDCPQRLFHRSLLADLERVRCIVEIHSGWGHSSNPRSEYRLSLLCLASR